MKVYYAHPISSYNTEQEADDIRFLKSMGLTVVNPAKLSKFVKPMQYKMKYFCGLVQKCDCLAFRSFSDTRIGSGVLLEIKAMKEIWGFVFELKPSIMSDRKLSIPQTKTRIERILKR